MGGKWRQVSSIPTVSHLSRDVGTLSASPEIIQGNTLVQTVAADSWELSGEQ